MADSVRESLITAVQDALQGAGGGEIEVIRSLNAALSREQLPVMVVTPTAEDVSRSDHDSDQRVLTIRVMVITGDPDSDGGSVDQKSDPILADVEKRLLSDPTFGGLASWTEVSHIDWFMEDSDQVYLGATLTAQVTYFTKRGDPTVSAA